MTVTVFDKLADAHQSAKPCTLTAADVSLLYDLCGAALGKGVKELDTKAEVQEEYEQEQRREAERGKHDETGFESTGN